MRTLGKLMVIWGLLFPLILLPSAGSGSQRFMPVFDVHFGPLHMELDTVLQAGLILVGVGLSFCALPRGLLLVLLSSGSGAGR
ncbi:hypothetical protein [Skermanella pratensis]|uniref:hypothetical protein n=1 Tax=Skermanella pratensis TaxID=2233999 RepID=UPI001300EE27|nr:hypothetical protein [Skermanella pratensis]